MPPAVERARSRSLAAIVTIALALSASACIGGDESTSIKPGVCVADETKDVGDVVPDLSTVVDCREPHVYEVYDVIDLPAKALSGSSSRKGRIENRDDLALPSELPDDSPEREAYEEFAERECAESLQRVTGYDEVKLDGASAEDARVVPALRGINAPWYTVMPEKEWLEGRRQVVCSARFERTDRAGPGRTPADPRASKDRRMILTKIGEESLPIAFRQCRAYDKKRTSVEIASCARPHVDEALLYFEADGVFDAKFIASIEKRPTPKKFDRFDKVCADGFSQVLGPDWDRKALRGFGAVARRWTEKNKTVRCAVGPENFRTNDLPPGSLVGTGAKVIELVRTRS